MYRAIVVVAVLSFCGCGRQGDSKSAQASSTPAVVTTIVATASNSLIKSEPKPSEILSDEGQIRVAASEYMLRNELKYLTNKTIFVSLTNTEMQALAANLTGCRFRSFDKMIADDDGNLRDSETGGKGFGLKVWGVKINTNEATVALATSGRLFECQLSKKPSEWIVLNVLDGGDADFLGWERRYP
jgi:hypothetical protein